MFDCPEPIHTSPTSTSFDRQRPDLSAHSGAAAVSLSSLTTHLPSAPAVVDFSWSRNFTVTSSPAPPLP